MRLSFRVICLSLLALSIAPSARSQPAGQQDRSGTKSLSIGDKAEVRFSARWAPSAVAYSNATELVVMRKALARAEGDQKEREVEYPEARILITTEPRTSQADAVKRLSQLAASREGSVKFLEIGGWPALEATFVEEVQRIGKNPPPPAFAQRGLVAIASENRLVRFEISLVPDAELGLLHDALQIAHSATFPKRGDPGAVKQTLQKLGASRPARTPMVSPGKSPGAAREEKRSSAGAAGTGAPVVVQNGVGELEVATSADANTIVIASNAVESFSTNRGVLFAPGNPGVFPLNDPSLARAVSGNFYLGVIAFPDGTAAQGNQTGCTNAVSRSTDSGANFGLQGFSALCPLAGAGICFPDQEHIAADAVTATAGGSDQLYAVWRNFVPGGAPPASCGGINIGFPTTSISCSQDNGATWTARAAIAGAGDFPRVAVGQDGSVYVTSITGSTVTLNKFTSCANGLAAVAGFPTTPVVLTATVGCPVPGLDRCNSGNTLSSPTVAPNPLDSNHLFVTAAESDTTGGERIITTESRDAGLTFPRQRTISGATSARRFMPWSCSTLGNVWVGWYDRRAAQAAGANNDLTDYFIGSAVSTGGGAPSLVAGSSRNLTNNPDPQCASGWPCRPRSSADSDSCTVQPQLAGRCRTAGGGGSNAPCDFSAGGCPAGETCTTGGGCPKYGDYNGIACAGNFVIAAWASATAPAGLPAAAGLTVFSSVENVSGGGGGGVIRLCRLHPELCFRPTKFDLNKLIVKCDTLPCLIIDQVDQNCLRKWPCPGCGPFDLCPPYYHMIFDDTVSPWEINLVDGEGRDVPHKLTKIGKNVVLTLRPTKKLFQDGSIGNYAVIFKAGKSIKAGVEYEIHVRLQVSDKAVPDLKKLPPE